MRLHLLAAHPIGCTVIASLKQIAPRLKKLLLMLSSDRDGEVVNAARLIDTTLRGAGCDWHDLTTRLLVPGETQTSRSDRNDDSQDWHTMRQFCLRHAHLLRPREREFLINLGEWHGDLTEKQFAWLDSIHVRVRRTAT
jgi:hypothetical protein